MKQSKKIFTRLCLNNWGGITHQIIEFHESVNLFSGKSGSGKSTVMDAIQVILYGSFSPNFLNKAADDAKNKRSVLSYLRGEQKDGSANRDGKDFCSTIVLEILDTATHITTCVGFSFEVRKTDSELKRFQYFSHSGTMPEGLYLNEDGIPFTGKEVRKLVEERAKSSDNRGKSDVNRIYPSKEAYLNVLYDSILGYIDGNRFVTMEKSAIALKMTNGTAQFIRDYMFPKSTGDTIQRISEQLGAYQEIKNRIEDLKKRIDALTEVKIVGRNIVGFEVEKLQAQRTILCMDIENARQKIKEKSDTILQITEQIKMYDTNFKELTEERSVLEDELIEVSAALKASDLGAKIQALEELEKRATLLSNDYNQWNRIVKELHKWEEDDLVRDYVSNPMLNRLTEFYKGNVSLEACDTLRNNIVDTKKDLEVEFDDYNEQRKEVLGNLNEMKALVDDITHDRKPYPDSVKKARAALAGKLSDQYGRSIHVHVFADLFDIKDESWKNAIEGRLGRLKLSLITEPQYAHDAAVAFKTMKQFENVELIHAKAIMNKQPQADEKSLYEAVQAEASYVDACLKHYLGRVIKCDCVDDLEKVRDGVTRDCYAYSNFIFRHFKEKDYTTFACIGTKVSKAKLKEYQEKLTSLQEEYAELSKIVEALKQARSFEGLQQDSDYLKQLSSAQDELEKVVVQKGKLELEIRELREGTFRQLEEKEKELKQERKLVDAKITENNTYLSQSITTKTQFENDIKFINTALEKDLMSYIPDEALEEKVRIEYLPQYFAKRRTLEKAITDIDTKMEAEQEILFKVRNNYIREYPNCGFSGAEKSNEKYETLLAQYESDYEEKYLREFEKQAKLIKQTLRDNVLATIHGDIKAARRHTYEINRLLRETNFSDSTYQIKIEPAKDENGQFYEMLMAEELDSKNIDNGGITGQLSFGEATFYEKYETKINQLIEKFMPASSDDKFAEQKQKEMEYYSDYRNYLCFTMYEQVTDEAGIVIRENYVDDMAGKDSGGEGQNPKYVALLAGFAMLYMQQTNRDSKIKLVLLDEAFSKMDQERSAVCLKYARKMNLQLIVCVPDERLQSLIRNVDSVYGFRRFQNRIHMMHIDKGDYLQQLEGEDEQ
ncbi:MAG: SbcC/MukB-like Walker B domain-containing protein [Lachnospiraceae bacterium]